MLLRAKSLWRRNRSLLVKKVITQSGGIFDGASEEVIWIGKTKLKQWSHYDNTGNWSLGERRRGYNIQEYGGGRGDEACLRETA